MAFIILSQIAFYLHRNLDHLSGKFDNWTFLGDCNSVISSRYLNPFSRSDSLKTLLKDTTFFKNHSKSTCNDLILTNQPRSFQSSYTIDTGLSDFYKFTVTVLKTYFKKQEPNFIMYWDNKKFSNYTFREEFVKELYEKKCLNRSVWFIPRYCATYSKSCKTLEVIMKWNEK